MALDYIQPLGDNIYLEMDERKEEKPGLIVLQETRHQRTEIGTVIAMGSRLKIPDQIGYVTDLQIGDRVLISFYTGVQIQIPETISKEPLHRIVKEYEILAKITK